MYFIMTIVSTEFIEVKLSFKELQRGSMHIRREMTLLPKLVLSATL
jgi:hypothetical protein